MGNGLVPGTSTENCPERLNFPRNSFSGVDFTLTVLHYSFLLVRTVPEFANIELDFGANPDQSESRVLNYVN